LALGRALVPVKGEPFTGRLAESGPCGLSKIMMPWI
jgi:hypothetical protein